MSDRGPRILSFCRPYLTRDFRENLAPLSSDFQIEFLTDGRSPGTRDTRAAFYAALRHGQPSPELSAADQQDVLARCRLLRNLPRDRAASLMHAMANVLGAELDAVKPDVVICHWVDEYITHLLSILSQRRGARFLGYALSYFPGLIQIAHDASGAPMAVRTPADDEVETVHQRIAPKAFRQNYQQRDRYTMPAHLKALARYRVKLAVFGARSLLERDPWNLHYTITPYIVERRRLRDFPRPALFAADWRQELARLRGDGARGVVYLPLAYFPECAVDYWVEDRRILQYQQITLDIIRALTERFVVVVKEHVQMMGARDVAFLEAIQALPNVVSVHPMEYSNGVLEAADAVILGGGSVGIEATIRDRTVLSFCPSSYWFEASGATALPLGDLASWPGTVAARIAAHRPLAPQERLDFLRACMKTTVRSRPGGAIWPLMEPQDLRRLIDVALIR